MRKAGYPGTRIVPALSWLLPLLALKLTRTRRVSHVDDLLLTDPAAALLAGLATLPKKSALTDYSYRTGHDHQRRFLAALDTTMIERGLASAENAHLRPGLPRRHALGTRPRPRKSTMCPPAPNAPAPC